MISFWFHPKQRRQFHGGGRGVLRSGKPIVRGTAQVVKERRVA